MSVPPCKRADEAHRRAAQLVGTIPDALAAHLVRAGLTVPVPTEQRNSYQGHAGTVGDTNAHTLCPAVGPGVGCAGANPQYYPPQGHPRPGPTF
jgi:hypothetical protein